MTALSTLGYGFDILQNKVALYAKGCTDHAPLFTVVPPESVALREGDCLAHFYLVCDTLELDLNNFDFKLFKLIVLTPENYRELPENVTTFTQTGWALWDCQEDEDDSTLKIDCYGEGDDVVVNYLDKPSHIYQVKPLGALNPKDTQLESLDNILGYVDDLYVQKTPVGWLDCGKII